ncbi:hypothetical protein CEUSTIGMA_g6836.t1 [Chlamydomonas eustigma]|uniref:MI domain-containing protein n=1 Tax=Chlamydomonas eustigma TaxID=1157962 RepID=A0A250X8J7_9CHLO|nr:hypothetical protein CEUSTIGMA_g6836.t1 [Chlamydomonas eustigma]|eukprot:GAX79395.1 hypothetical protein CEUSTIGMA_g6836.t1 [Chlamydomonas eustigma]
MAPGRNGHEGPRGSAPAGGRGGRGGRGVSERTQSSAPAYVKKGHENGAVEKSTEAIKSTNDTPVKPTSAWATKSGNSLSFAELLKQKKDAPTELAPALKAPEPKEKVEERVGKNEQVQPSKEKTADNVKPSVKGTTEIQFGTFDEGRRELQRTNSAPPGKGEAKTPTFIPEKSARPSSRFGKTSNEDQTTQNPSHQARPLDAPPTPVPAGGEWGVPSNPHDQVAPAIPIPPLAAPVPLDNATMQHQPLPQAQGQTHVQLPPQNAPHGSQKHGNNYGNGGGRGNRHDRNESGGSVHHPNSRAGGGGNYRQGPASNGSMGPIPIPQPHGMHGQPVQYQSQYMLPQGGYPGQGMQYNQFHQGMPYHQAGVAAPGQHFAFYSMPQGGPPGGGFVTAPQPFLSTSPTAQLQPMVMQQGMVMGGMGPAGSQVFMPQNPAGAPPMTLAQTPPVQVPHAPQQQQQSAPHAPPPPAVSQYQGPPQYPVVNQAPSQTPPPAAAQVPPQHGQKSGELYIPPNIPTPPKKVLKITNPTTKESVDLKAAVASASVTATSDTAHMEVEVPPAVMVTKFDIPSRAPHILEIKEPTNEKKTSLSGSAALSSTSTAPTPPAVPVPPELPATAVTAAEPQVADAQSAAAAVPAAAPQVADAQSAAAAAAPAAASQVADAQSAAAAVPAAAPQVADAQSAAAAAAPAAAPQVAAAHSAAPAAAVTADSNGPVTVPAPEQSVVSVAASEQIMASSEKVKEVAAPIPVDAVADQTESVDATSAAVARTAMDQQDKPPSLEVQEEQESKHKTEEAHPVLDVDVVDTDEEEDEWEHAEGGLPVESAPELEETPALSADGRKAYSRDYMKKMALAPECNVKLAPKSILDYAEELLLPEPIPFEDVMAYGGRSGAGTPNFGRGGAGNEGEWGGRRVPSGYGMPQGGGPRGMMGMPGGGPPSVRRGVPMDAPADNWKSRGQPPPPSPGVWDPVRTGSGRSSGSNLHKTGNRYTLGQTQSADPDEEKKQRSFKGILNKLTIDNFEKLSGQILEVGIVQQKTLEGLIDQIFDKALTETNFCEMYAQLCSKLASAKDAKGEIILPTFENPNKEQKPIDLRRLLLSKCQSEFEKGIEADTRVKAREEQETKGGAEESATASNSEAPSATPETTPVAADTAASKAEESTDPAAKEVPAAAPAEELEEGEIPPSPAPPPPTPSFVDPKAAAELERQARRRMLGNMQFIGQLYKYALLTERIMHNCVQQLLQDDSLPRPEDVECLCKLLTTVGGKLETTVKVEQKQRLKLYFERMKRLTENLTLESRIRFMVQDVLDLRDRKWQPRQKVEGPKKISEVHQDAMRQQMQQQERDRDENRRAVGGGIRGGRMDGPSPRGGGGPPMFNESRLLSREDVPTKTVSMTRQQSTEISLRPGNYSRSRPMGVGVQPQLPSRVSPPRSTQASVAPPPLSTPGVPALSEDKIKTKATNLVEELWANALNMTEGLANIDDLRKAGASMSVAISAIVNAAMNHRGKEVEERLPPIVDLFMAAAAASPPAPHLSSEELKQGALLVAKELHSLADDLPKAPDLTGLLYAALIERSIVSLKDILQTVQDVPPIEEEGDAPLVDGGHGTTFIYGILTRILQSKGEQAAADVWRSSGMQLDKFVCSLTPMEPAELKAEVDKHGLSFLV